MEFEQDADPSHAPAPQSLAKDWSYRAVYGLTTAPAFAALDRS